jgi:hypothetical protein
LAEVLIRGTSPDSYQNINVANYDTGLLHQNMFKIACLQIHVNFLEIVENVSTVKKFQANKEINF